MGSDCEHTPHPQSVRAGASPFASVFVTALNVSADVLAAECGVLALRDLVRPYLKSPVDSASDAPLVRRLRRLLDDRLVETFTIAEVAVQFGFPDQSHLNRPFRRTLGTTPDVCAA